MKTSYIIGGIVIISAMAMAMFSFQSSLTPYVTVSEAKARKQPVQVAGVVAQGTKRYDLENNNLVFTLREDGGDEMIVEYDGQRPANFDDVTKIVVIGKFEPEKQAFAATELLVKCPTKYEGRVKAQ